MTIKIKEVYDKFWGTGTKKNTLDKLLMKTRSEHEAVSETIAKSGRVVLLEDTPPGLIRYSEDGYYFEEKDFYSFNRDLK